MFEVRPYSNDNAAEWNAFIAGSKQGTFLLDRGYMDYHRDRFDDFSLMVYFKSKLFALLPANRVGTTLFHTRGSPTEDSSPVLRLPPPRYATLSRPSTVISGKAE